MTAAPAHRRAADTAPANPRLPGSGLHSEPDTWKGTL